MPTHYTLEHTVGFEETSLVGNVYFTNYLLWQGHCRERFLLEHAPEVLELLSGRRIQLFTRNCSCDYTSAWGFSALDRVLVEMRLESFRGGRMTLAFRYAHAERPAETIATGKQELCCVAATDEGWVAAPFPSSLAMALRPYSSSEEQAALLDDAIAFNEARGA